MWLELLSVKTCRQTLRWGTLAAWLTLSACTTQVHNAHGNRAWAPLEAGVTAPARDIAGTNLVALSFSGGGLRAAAFSFGVLKALDASSQPGESLLDDVTLITSVSGGSLTAAYYGLHGPQALNTFRDKVLLRDMEASMRMSAFAPENFLRVLAGGLNDRANLVNWLDSQVFEGATFATLYARRKPDVWINATDLYHRTPFPFIPPMFHALCSDLTQFSVAEAVSASMAVPLVFSPIVLKTFPEKCQGTVEPWVERALSDPGASKIVHASAQAMKGYRDPSRVRFVKLVDGGVTDNYGLSSILLGRAVSRTSYGPLTARDAVTLQRMLFLVVDAGRGPSGDWALAPDGPSGLEVALAATDSAIDSAARVGFDAFRKVMHDWQTSVIAFRCSLPLAEVERLRGSVQGWNCRDIQFHFGLVSFADLGPVREAGLNAIPTRLTLPTKSIDDAIAAGFDAARANVTLKTYLHNRIPQPVAPPSAP
ncbi:MAG: patatin-like phospholipase family protein [Burkholderiales bacterium]|nr:patatin-like phospholipase family protein [Burkholderiales bacterium]